LPFTGFIEVEINFWVHCYIIYLVSGSAVKNDSNFAKARIKLCQSLSTRTPALAKFYPNEIILLSAGLKYQDSTVKIINNTGPKFSLAPSPIAK